MPQPSPDESAAMPAGRCLANGGWRLGLWSPRGWRRTGRRTGRHGLFGPGGVVAAALVMILAASDPAPALGAPAPDTAPPAVTDPRALPRVDGGVVTAVIDGDTLVLEDGREVRLTGIQAPKLPLGRPDFPTWPLAPEAKARLAALSLNKTVALHAGGARQDRHGRLLGHLVTVDGLWLQGRMVAEGLARVYTFADNRALAAPLLALERAARAAKRGIWALDWYALRPPDPNALDAEIGTFQVIEGRLVRVAHVGKTVYLNFGENWRRDVTVSFPDAVLEAFHAQGRDPLVWDGQRIRVRGWLSRRNGPMISLTHPEALEGPLDESPRAAEAGPADTAAPDPDPDPDPASAGGERPAR